ncbi:TLD domain-containing protein 1-like isoform X2 [Hibiscus syriacus]|uniref:TLD domain-containing protein 1-like isoform X2 n=1 Tax=Hibiscus syriacus TaxID=106335 RepID=A0A6A2XB41_HIBSY|nr:MTOR-associated protein MEAK7-like [Hibiscus syriacus]KAE8672472.1 TLD domain-containing protein 1-like isoform X2 [Hibiscus syriacus]
MGNSQSPPPNPRFNSASRAFAPKELEDLKSLFTSLAAQSQTNGQYVSSSVFQAYFGLKGPLGDRMFDLATQGRKDDRLTYEDLVITKGTYVKGTNDEIEEFIYRLLDVTDDEILTRSDLESGLVTMFDHIFHLKGSQPESSSSCYMVETFLNAATFSKDNGERNDKSMSFEDFRCWCTLVPSVKKFLSNLLVPPDPGRPGSQIPKLLHLENIDPNILLLRDEYAWHIGGALSHEEMEEWKLLYHSSLNGLSFNTFLGNILNDDGRTVLITKDREGYIFGGFASQPWERHSDFCGDMKSFLFQLYPVASIFRPTGANNNLRWCAANFSSETIPNGIGFGGRINHFGLFISASFDEGHTFSCTTFNSPCLSKTNKIYPEVIECWGIVRKGVEQEKADVVKGTVLERFKEDRHMLNMVGIANASE